MTRRNIRYPGKQLDHLSHHLGHAGIGMDHVYLLFLNETRQLKRRKINSPTQFGFRTDIPLHQFSAKLIELFGQTSSAGDNINFMPQSVISPRQLTQIRGDAAGIQMSS